MAKKNKDRPGSLTDDLKREQHKMEVWASGETEYRGDEAGREQLREEAHRQMQDALADDGVGFAEAHEQRRQFVTQKAKGEELSNFVKADPRDHPEELDPLMGTPPPGLSRQQRSGLHEDIDQWANSLTPEQIKTHRKALEAERDRIEHGQQIANELWDRFQHDHPSEAQHPDAVQQAVAEYVNGGGDINDPYFLQDIAQDTRTIVRRGGVARKRGSSSSNNDNDGRTAGITTGGGGGYGPGPKAKPSTLSDNLKSWGKKSGLW